MENLLALVAVMVPAVMEGGGVGEGEGGLGGAGGPGHENTISGRAPVPIIPNSLLCPEAGSSSPPGYLVSLIVIAESDCSTRSLFQTRVTASLALVRRMMTRPSAHCGTRTLNVNPRSHDDDVSLSMYAHPCPRFALYGSTA